MFKQDAVWIERKKALSDSLNELTKTIDSIKTVSIEQKTNLNKVEEKIETTSKNLSDLSQIFKNSKSRGNLGEITLAWIMRNILGEEKINGIWQTQYTYKTGVTVETIIKTGIDDKKIAIDSKFLLQNTEILLSENETSLEYREAYKSFKKSINKMIEDLKVKYISHEEKIESVVMYIPSQVIFDLILIKFNDLFQKALDSRVWLASPTTLPAILYSQQLAIRDYNISKNLDQIRKTIIIIAKKLEEWEALNSEQQKHFNTYVDKTEESYKNINKIVTEINSNAKKINDANNQSN
ncbi:DNA recombination protein RmuC [Mycoplasma putrefaciens]|uniref:DNA recombination protein RmuC n=1 Tax=Mycoplasma putrefaciens TaxID=2123 RepID=UPI0019309FEF